MKHSLLLLGLTLAVSAYAQSPDNSQRRGPMQGGGQTAEESFNRRDINHDGFLSKTEIAGSRIESSFDKSDTNHDGKLSLAEYKAARDAMQKQGMQDMGGMPGKRDGTQMRGQMAEQRFKELDKNGDGFLSKEEVSGSRMAERFDALDSNKDGKLSLNELKAGMQNMGPPNQSPRAGQGTEGQGSTTSSNK
jgi:Ca2+-binding EF-hand superfamily protein